MRPRLLLVLLLMCLWIPLDARAIRLTAGPFEGLDVVPPPALEIHDRGIPEVVPFGPEGLVLPTRGPGGPPDPLPTRGPGGPPDPLPTRGPGGPPDLSERFDDSEFGAALEALVSGNLEHLGEGLQLGHLRAPHEWGDRFDDGFPWLDRDWPGRGSRPSSVPEPTTAALLVLGLLGLAASRR